MSRRRTSFFDDLVELGIKLPWWLSMSLALITGLVFRHFAKIEVAPAPGMEGMSAVVRTSMLKTAATFLQYIVPTAFLLGAALAITGRVRSNRLLQKATSMPGLHVVADMDWRQFEQLLGAVFRKQGFEVQETAAGPDGGVDLRLVKDEELFLVQCKHWRAQSVGVSIVREVYGVMAAAGAAGGYVVTAGNFTREARRFAVGRNVELVDGQLLAQWLAAVKEQDYRATSQVSVTVPLCPRCGESMELRRAKQGKYAGKEFFGCSNFPTCRGIRQV